MEKTQPNIHWLVRVAELGYRNDADEFTPDDRALFSKKASCQLVEVEYAQILLIREPENKRAVVVFRGVQDATERLRNSQTTRVPFFIKNIRYGKVHKGFYNYYDLVRPHIHTWLHEKHTEETIYFIGHNLGGCCLLAALETTMTIPEVHVACYTFGSPKVGNKSFARACVQNIKELGRIIHPLDPVVDMPSSRRFAHPCDPMHIDGIHEKLAVAKRQSWFGTLKQVDSKGNSIKKYMELFEPLSPSLAGKTLIRAGSTVYDSNNTVSK
jgi:hypothetical protein